MPAFINVAVKVDLGVKQFGMDATVDTAEAGELDRVLDVMTKAIGRQQTKQDLVERIMDLRDAKMFLSLWPQPKTAIVLQRQAERRDQEREFQRQHDQFISGRGAGKRLDWKPNRQQEQWFEAFDKQTEAKLAEADKMKEAKEKLIPNLEAQIERLREIINGRDPIEEAETSTAKIGAREAAD